MQMLLILFMLPCLKYFCSVVPCRDPLLLSWEALTQLLVVQFLGRFLRSQSSTGTTVSSLRSVWWRSMCRQVIGQMAQLSPSRPPGGRSPRFHIMGI